MGWSLDFIYKYKDESGNDNWTISSSCYIREPNPESGDVATAYPSSSSRINYGVGRATDLDLNGSKTIDHKPLIPSSYNGKILDNYSLLADGDIYNGDYYYYVAAVQEPLQMIIQIKPSMIAKPFATIHHRVIVLLIVKEIILVIQKIKF